jgi:hypothetical protein
MEAGVASSHPAQIWRRCKKMERRCPRSGGLGFPSPVQGTTPVEAAVGAVGCGYDLTGDLRLGRAKPVGRLVEIDAVRDAGPDPARWGCHPRLPSGIVADKGERDRRR